MNSRTEKFFLVTPAGQMECALDRPHSLSSDSTSEPTPRGLAIVAHPHPLYGGTMDNKVVHTLVRAFLDLGCVVVRMNFRGVGQSQGVHDHGVGETDDLWALWRFMTSSASPLAAQETSLSLYLAGFSFGAFVTAQVVNRLLDEGVTPRRVVLVGTPAKKWEVPTVPAFTELIHGEYDETIPLIDVLDWARPQQLTINVFPGADHFFHQRLVQLRKLVVDRGLA